MTEPHWVELATYASGLEADVVIARLEAEEIPVMRVGNDTTGIFGPGFQGTSPQGVTVRVPSDALEEARALLDDEGDGP